MNELTPRQARQQALQALALAKWLKDTVADTVNPLERAAKEWLIQNDLDPGSRVPAKIGDLDVATVSLTNPKPKLHATIEDEEEYGEWLEAQGHTNLWERRLRDHYTAPTFLTKLVEQLEGEVPDGVAVSETQSDPYIRVGQTEKQADALKSAIEALRALETVVEQITSGEPNE